MIDLKIRDILLGIAIGDAFGAGVEFQDREWIRANIDFSQLVNARATIQVPEDKLALFTKDYQAWDYTDDTEMTIGTIHALVSGKDFTRELLVEAWKEEYEAGIRKKGFGRNGHGSMGWYYEGQMTIDEIRAFQRDRKNPGNAPAMRAVPLGLIKEERINEYARINAEATHPNVSAIISSQCVARAAEFLLVKKGKNEQVVDYCMHHVALNQEYEAYLAGVNQLGKYEELTEEDFSLLCGAQPIEAPYFLPGIKGVPSDSMYTAGAVLFILKNSANAFDALQKSVNLGGDVDSVASIATGIMAGVTGLNSIPAFMLQNVEGVGYLEELAMKFEKLIQGGA